MVTFLTSRKKALCKTVFLLAAFSNKQEPGLFLWLFIKAKDIFLWIARPCCWKQQGQLSDEDQGLLSSSEGSTNARQLDQETQPATNKAPVTEEIIEKCLTGGTKGKPKREPRQKKRPTTQPSADRKAASKGPKQPKKRSQPIGESKKKKERVHKRPLAETTNGNFPKSLDQRTFRRKDNIGGKFPEKFCAYVELLDEERPGIVIEAQKVHPPIGVFAEKGTSVRRRSINRLLREIVHNCSKIMKLVQDGETDVGGINDVQWKEGNVPPTVQSGRADVDEELPERHSRTKDDDHKKCIVPRLRKLDPANNVSRRTPWTKDKCSQTEPDVNLSKRLKRKYSVKRDCCEDQTSSQYEEQTEGHPRVSNKRALE
ncbi:uncharacterized protein LOC135397412 [Ornithodoros turicata]|uniref:uncharacterized protein LOC135397412 n=1 Tax=Ornithodoros turicata TaxID=34597 RepID=UPI0031388C06